MADAPMKRSFRELYAPPRQPDVRKRYRKNYDKVDDSPLDYEKSKFKLEMNLRFFQLHQIPAPRNRPKVFRNKGEGIALSKKVVNFLRHDLSNSGLPYANDGFIRMSDLIQFWRRQRFYTTEEKIVAARPALLWDMK